MKIKNSLEKIAGKINDFSFMAGAFITSRIADISTTQRVVNNYGINTESNSQAREYMQEYGTLLGNVVSDVVPQTFIESTPLLIGAAYLLNKYYKPSINSLKNSVGNKLVLLPATILSLAAAINNLIVYSQYASIN